MKDAKREYVKVLEVATAAKTVVSATAKCGTAGDKQCTKTGFKNLTTGSRLNDVFNTKGCSAVTKAETDAAAI